MLSGKHWLLDLEMFHGVDGDLSGWGNMRVSFGAVGAAHLRSMSEPFGEESERRAPGGGPLSWEGHGGETLPAEKGGPLETRCPN